VPLGGAAARVGALLEEVQAALLAGARARQAARTEDVATAAEAAEVARRGVARVPYAAVAGEEGAAALAGTGATVRALLRPDGGLPDTGDAPDLVALVARAY
jgi:prolyl-tRNA synthetase